MRKPIVPPERMMSEAAPLRNACQEHLLMPTVKPVCLSSEEARWAMRLPKMRSNLEPPVGDEKGDCYQSAHSAPEGGTVPAAEAGARDARPTGGSLPRGQADRGRCRARGGPLLEDDVRVVVVVLRIPLVHLEVEELVAAPEEEGVPDHVGTNPQEVVLLDRHVDQPAEVRPDSPMFYPPNLVLLLGAPDD